MLHDNERKVSRIFITCNEDDPHYKYAIRWNELIRDYLASDRASDWLRAHNQYWFECIYEGKDLDVSRWMLEDLIDLDLKRDKLLVMRRQGLEPYELLREARKAEA